MTWNGAGEKIDRTVRRMNRWADEKDDGLGRLLAQAVDLPVRTAWHVWRNRRYLTTYKLANMGVVSLERLVKREQMRGLPYIIKVEPTNICNSTCRLCPTGLGLPGREKGKMSYESFCRVIDEIKRFAYVVDLSNWGDPLIVPDIYKMIRYAHEANLWTYVSSNLHAFHAEDAEAMVRSGLNMLNCSLHGATQETYEIYQPGKKMELVLEKIRTILEVRARLKSRTPQIQLYFVVTKYNEHQVKEFRGLAKNLECNAVFSTASLNLRLTKKDEQAGKIEKWLPRDEKWVAPWYRDNQPEKSPAGKKRKVYPCDWPWWGAVINWDGAISVCCGDFDPRWEMGNIFKEPLRTIWNNEKYRAVRRSFKSAGHDNGAEPCKSCSGVLI
jgi:radical SAM protein with 4Fe4S-binding SPASM domain